MKETEARFKGFPVVWATLENLKAIKSNGYTHFVWPNEGEFIWGMKGKKFVFNNDFKEWQPLGIDITSQGMLMSVYKAMDKKHHEKFARMVCTHRGNFIKLVDFGWSVCTPKM